jgi:hypothetical protein
MTRSLAKELAPHMLARVSTDSESVDRDRPGAT